MPSSRDLTTYPLPKQDHSHLSVWDCACSLNFPQHFPSLLPRAHAQGVKQSVCRSVVHRRCWYESRQILGMHLSRRAVSTKTVDIGEQLVSVRFELLEMAH